VLDSASNSYSELEISVGEVGPLLVPPTLSTDYSSIYCPKKCLSTISKEGMPTLDGTRRRSHRSFAWTGYKGAPQHEASTRKYYLAHPQKRVRPPAPVSFGTTERLGFPLLVGTPLKPRVQLFFLTKELCCSLLRMIRELSE